jgi:asparagine synthase (glutamine-hydrolysing)
MCGIAGIRLNDRAALFDRARVDKMVAAIHHRGPDGTGAHIEPGVAFGHARLSIIDLAGGAQPLSNSDDTIWITFNGEIFNYLELRETLKARGHKFRTSSDTEVIVHAYEAFGLDFVNELNGQFAFAIWDRRHRRLVLARDRTGILPLFYARTAQGLAFASEVKALIAGGIVKPELDPQGFDELMTFWAPVAPRTVFKGVSQVCPGEMLIQEEGAEPVRHAYWKWHFPKAGSHRRGDKVALQGELRDILTDATQLRLRADVPVGAYLSGGLDSSTVVALLKEKVPETLETFSIGFEDGGLDETAHQQHMATRFETRHHQMRVSNDDVANGFMRTIAHTESPVLRTAPSPMRLLSSLVRRSNVKVVLTGEGADEVLGGYDIFKEAKVRQFWARNPASKWRPALLKRLYPYLDFTTSQSDAYLREFFGAGLDHPDDPCFGHGPRWATTSQCKIFLSDAWREQAGGSAIERFKASLPAEVSGWHAFNKAEYVEARTLLPSYLLSSQGDRMLMANSVEGRFPYLDHRLIEFANDLHPTYKMHVMKEKHLLKEAMRGRLPAEILDRHKQPYRAPDAAAFLQGGKAPDYVNELLNGPCIARYGYFDPDKVSRLIAKLSRARVPAPRDNMAFVGILSTQMWHALFVEGQSIP